MYKKIITGLLIFCGGIVVTIGFPAIYKWVDDQGRVHYSDTPPINHHHEKIGIAPAPSTPTNVEEKNKTKKIDANNKTAVDRNSEESKPETNEDLQPSKPINQIIANVACFIPQSDAWQGKIADTRDAVSRRPLTNSEFRQLQRLLDDLSGHWSGTLTDTTCRHPASQPPIKTDYYRVQLDATQHPAQRYEISADMEGEKTTRAIRQHYFWLLVDQDGLRFRSTQANRLFTLDLPGNDVEILDISDDTLTFFWRRGGTPRRTTVFSLSRTGYQFTINEYFYLQGELAGKRRWILEK